MYEPAGRWIRSDLDQSNGRCEQSCQVPLQRSNIARDECLQTVGATASTPTPFMWGAISPIKAENVSKSTSGCVAPSLEAVDMDISLACSVRAASKSMAGKGTRHHHSEG